MCVCVFICAASATRTSLRLRPSLSASAGLLPRWKHAPHFSCFLCNFSGNFPEAVLGITHVDFHCKIEMGSQEFCNFNRHRAIDFRLLKYFFYLSRCPSALFHVTVFHLLVPSSPCGHRTVVSVQMKPTPQHITVLIYVPHFVLQEGEGSGVETWHCSGFAPVSGRYSLRNV